MALTGSAYKRLFKELSQLQQSPAEGVRVAVDDSDISSIHGWIQGPPHTPYENGYFKIRFEFGSDFPNAPPKCWFMTKIFHPNINVQTGEICVSTLKKDWKKEYGVGHILITVKCLLIHPNPESALHEEAGKLLLEAYDDFAKHARLMTDVHARYRPPEFANAVNTSNDARSSSSSTSLKPVSHTAHSSNIPPQDPSAMLVDEKSSNGVLSSSIPKKRPIPLAAATPSTVLGASTAVITNNGNTAMRKLPSTAGQGSSSTASAPAQKKRGLKRL